MVFSIIKWILNQKMVSINGFSIKKWFPKIWFLNQKMVSIKRFLNQKMVSQNMVSQSKNGFPKYGFFNHKMVPISWFSIILWYSSRGFHHIYKNIMIYMFFQTYGSRVRLNYWEGLNHISP